VVCKTSFTKIMPQVQRYSMCETTRDTSTAYAQSLVIHAPEKRGVVKWLELPSSGLGANHLGISEVIDGKKMISVLPPLSDHRPESSNKEGLIYMRGRGETEAGGSTGMDISQE
jgi:hypothetical protein